MFDVADGMGWVWVGEGLLIFFQVGSCSICVVRTVS